MRILVTGATGQVGRRFVPRLPARVGPAGSVRLLVRDETRAEPLTRLGARAVTGELRDTGDIRRAVAGVDAVVNIAASFRGVPDEEAWAINRDAALDLGRAALEAGVGRFVQVSTNLVYGAGRGRPAVEDDGARPDTPRWGAYPASKREAEDGCWRWTAWTSASDGSPSSTARATPTWRSPCAWRASGPPTNGSRWSTTRTSPRPCSGCSTPRAPPAAPRARRQRSTAR